MIVIELAEHVAKEFLNLEKRPKVFNRHNLPFETFTVSYPYRVMQTEEEVVKGALEGMPEAVRKEAEKEGPLKKIRSLAKKIANSDVWVTYKTEKDSGVVEVRGRLLQDYAKGEDTLLFSFLLPDILPMPLVKVNETAVHPELFALQLCNLLANTIHYIESPRKEILVSEKRELATGKGSKKNRKSKKTYLYKKVFKFLNIPEDTEEKEKRTMTRHTDAWEVRGHWRTYKSGKRVWVKAYTKGDPEALVERKPYRITQTLDET